MPFSIINYTPFNSKGSVLYDENANQIWVIIIKATYNISNNGFLSLADEQEEVCLFPKYDGEFDSSDMIRDSEMVFEHPGTDIIINGSAHASNKPHVTVGVTVGEIKKYLNVYGDRYWENSILGLNPSQAKPFSRLSLSYKKAFGGKYYDSNKGEQVFFRSNPIGVGFFRNKREAKDSLLPNIENINQPITSWRKYFQPAGFGCIPQSWEPRRQLAGTVTAEWKKSKAPLWPDDYSPLFHVSAPDGLHHKKPLKGGEQVKLINLSEEGMLNFEIPREFLYVFSIINGSRVRHKTQMDRLIIEPDRKKNHIGLASKS